MSGNNKEAGYVEHFNVMTFRVHKKQLPYICMPKDENPVPIKYAHRFSNYYRASDLKTIQGKRLEGAGGARKKMQCFYKQLGKQWRAQ